MDDAGAWPVHPPAHRWALLWLTDRETRDAGRTHCFSFDRKCAVTRAWCGWLWVVAVWQSADQREREIEAADAGSVARLVRGV